MISNSISLKGYYLIKSLTASQKSKLVDFYLEKLKSINATVVAFTCDGPPTNVAMAQNLGVKYELLNSSTKFIHHSDVRFMHDPAHMLKLIRNCLKDYQHFYINEDVISWKYIEILYHYQVEHKICLANKLTKKHIDCQSKTHFHVIYESLPKNIFTTTFNSEPSKDLRYMSSK